MSGEIIYQFANVNDCTVDIWEWICNLIDEGDPGPRLNIKTVLSMYGDFRVKDKNMGIAMSGKTVFLIETAPLVSYQISEQSIIGSYFRSITTR